MQTKNQNLLYTVHIELLKIYFNKPDFTSYKWLFKTYNVITSFILFDFAGTAQRKYLSCLRSSTVRLLDRF